MLTSEHAETWRKRISASQIAHTEWKRDKEVDTCKEYWKGDQRRVTKDRQGDKLMIVNRILPAVRTALPSLYYREPFIKVTASPARADTPAQQIDQRKQLLQDTGNTIIRDPETMFMDQTFISMKEAFWSLACIEVGYTADFVDNPTSEGKPPLEEKEGEDQSLQAILAQLKSELQRTITEERFYVRRIDPDSLLFSEKDSSVLKELDWVGYSEMLYVEDIKKSPAYKNTEKLPPGEEGQILCHKIWDIRTHTRYVLPEGGDDFILEEPFKRVPLFYLRFEIEPGKFRPIPLIQSWLSSQDEYNDSRETLRKNRKARQVKFTVDPSKLKPEEAKKLESEEVGIYVFTEDNKNDGTAIHPVVMPPMDTTVLSTMSVSRSEFDEVSGTAAQSRQVSTGETATEASIINNRQNIIENFDREKVAKWLAAIARELILQAVDKMALPKWVLLNSDPYSEYFLLDALSIAKVYRQITFQQLQIASDSLRWDVSVDVESMGPVPEQQRRLEWMSILTLLRDGGMARLLALSPELLKKTLDLHGIRSAQEQAWIAQALSTQAQIEMSLLMGGTPSPGLAGLPQPQGPQPIPGPALGPRPLPPSPARSAPAARSTLPVQTPNRAERGR